jgi:hypothetical protein
MCVAGIAVQREDGDWEMGKSYSRGGLRFYSASDVYIYIYIYILIYIHPRTTWYHAQQVV